MKTFSIRLIPTWFWECLVVLVALTVTAVLNGFSKVEVLCGLAVFFSFCHAQVADRMSEKQALMTQPDVECHRWSNRYFLIKEILWITFFLMVGSYSAIVGSALFFAYPFWRKFYMARKRP